LWFEVLEKQQNQLSKKLESEKQIVTQLVSQPTTQVVTQLVWTPESTITRNECMFNSHVAESCLHLIPDLAEQFVYLCDEMFMGRPVDRNLFFTDDGRPILHVRFSERQQNRKPQFLGSSTNALMISHASSTHASMISHASSSSTLQNVVPRVKELVVSNSAYRKKPSSYMFAWEGALATANECLDVLQLEYKFNRVNTFTSRSPLVTGLVKPPLQSLMRKPGISSSSPIKIESDFPRPELMHCCSPLLKQGFVDLWSHPKIQPVLERTRLSVFRKTSDVHTVYLVSLYLLMTGRATYYGFNNSILSMTSSPLTLTTTSAPLNPTVLTSQDTTSRRPAMLYTELVHLGDAIKKLARGTTDVYCLNDAHDLPTKTCTEIMKLIRTQLPHHQS
jgi:hypothetical protein